ncbi:DUF4440 domain-containing protein [Rubrobacter marinus]|uniref:DUF4440 domain-containing protein n=1 Tax=Rubrobacter marinus TaxID=2653852 RepID=A0A6G8PZZ1_9ACTN|nr:nuclear transport factor 2 family protein [Rubrobacter marinus]QIN79793.1 DUF4440 domain-containing protein [Rubrobacter marinus]
MDERAVRQVLRAERERLDAGALDRLMSPHYLGVDAEGRCVDREQVLSSLRSGERGRDESRSDEHRVRVHGSTAVVVGRWRARGTNAGPSTTRRATSRHGSSTTAPGGWSATSRP